MCGRKRRRIDFSTSATKFKFFTIFVDSTKDRCILAILARVLSKVISWFPIVTKEENLVVFQTVFPTSVKKATKFGLAVFTNMVLLFLAVNRQIW